MKPSTDQSPYQDFITRLETPIVRQLAGAVFAPPLLQMQSLCDAQHGIAAPLSIADAQHRTGPLFNLNNAYQQWLIKLDKQPEKLIEYVSSERRLKLGMLHERLWQFFLANNEQTQLLGANIKVSDKGQDVGEFDLVYQHPQYGLVHLEVASKYYLASETDTTQWQHWIGPGKKDRLDIKLAHSIDKQANLADRDGALDQLIQTVDSLDPLSSPQLHKQLHIGGRLFYRYDLANLLHHLRQHAAAPNGSIPTRLNPDHRVGHWVHFGEWQQLCTELAIEYRLLDKHQWLEPNLHRDDADGWQSGDNIEASSEGISNAMQRYNKESPIMVGYRGADLPTQICFIVPDNW